MMGKRRSRESQKTTALRRRKPLTLETLESRMLLSADGVILGDARLTLSFAPDGTEVAGASSTLFEQMDELAPHDQWQSAILRGFQIWGRETNGDIGVVSDDGTEFGAAGQMRRDPRFGDIRIGSIPLADELYATSVSSAKVVDGTWTGDVLFNSNLNFQNVDELFAVAVHEAGHVFGLTHNTDPNSPMFEHGIPNSTTPTANDIAELQDIFGPRSSDVFDLKTENGGNGQPVELELFRTETGEDGSAPTVAFADISALDDVDEYLVEAPSNYAGSVTVQLVTSGISLLTTDLTVMTETGTPLGEAISFAPGTDTAVTVNNVGDNEKLRIDVQANGADEYAIGGYSIVVWFDETNEVDAESITKFLREPIRHIDPEELEEYFEEGQTFLANDDDGSDDDEGMENRLTTSPGFVEGTKYQIQASIEGVGDVDRYAIKTPVILTTGNNWGRLTLRAIDSDFVGEIRVFDESFVELPTSYLVHNDETAILQLGPVQANTDYFIEIAAAADSPSFLGNYELHAQFGVSELPLETFLSGTLRSTTDFFRQRLSVRRPQLFQFRLDVGQANPGVELQFQIIDLRGNVLSTLTSNAGDTRTTAVFLPNGNYRVVVRAAGGSAAFLDVDYTLSGATIDDPLGPRLDDTTDEPFSFEDRMKILVALAVFQLR